MVTVLVFTSLTLAFFVPVPDVVEILGDGTRPRRRVLSMLRSFPRLPSPLSCSTPWLSL